MVILIRLIAAVGAVCHYTIKNELTYKVEKNEIIRNK